MLRIDRSRLLNLFNWWLPGILLLYCPCASALDPSLDVSQYAHTAWRIREGFSRGVIQAIAQTPDGYLWLGTQFGLLRFDGARAVPWPPPTDEQLPGSDIYHLVTAHDGTLWIGTTKGLASWKSGRLTQYPQLAGQNILALLEDNQGTVWAGTSGNTAGNLCAVQSGMIQCYGGNGRFGGGVLSFYEDSAGILWVGALDGVWKWKPGAPNLYPMQAAEMRSMLANPGFNQDLFKRNTDAVLKAALGEGNQITNDTRAESPIRAFDRHITALRSLRDRNGGLWIGTLDRGLLHVHQGRVDVFSQSDGLSGDLVRCVFEDAERNIWVATGNGLDRFREFPIPTISVKQGLSNTTVFSVLAASDGAVWLGTFDGLNRVLKGQITIYRKRGEPARRNALAGVTEVTNSGLPDDVESLGQDERGRIWVSTHSGLTWFENGRFIPVSGAAGREVRSIAGDNAGNTWISHSTQGLLRVLNGNVVERFPWSALGLKDYARALVANPMNGGVWLGMAQGTLAYFKDRQIRESYSIVDASGHGSVTGLHLDHDGTLWAATESGLSRLKNSRIATLTSKNGLPCDTVHWVDEDDAHSLWLFMPCGLVRIARPELDAWGALADKNTLKGPPRSIHVTVFDSADGVRTRALAGGYSPHVAKSTDGKIWYTVQDGISVIDPLHLPFNKLPPPVHIEQITADRKIYDASGGLRLPPLVRDLTVDYTALSLVAPEKVLFRYKLEGRDPDWHEVGNRRQAFYTDLSPGNYRFRVTACNNSGVWNEAGAFLDFSIAAAYYQTIWFRALCAAAFGLILWGLYRLRVQHLARELNSGIEARVSERMRIARELHDTLLQSFQALALRFQAVDYMLPERAMDAKSMLESALDQADRAIVEGRDAIADMRTSGLATSDLAKSLTALMTDLNEEFAALHGTAPAFRVLVQGAPSAVRPVLQEELHRIARESLRNAFRHAQARNIETEITYGDSLVLRFRDDGKGIDPQVLELGGRSGHWGLTGIRERATHIRARLEIRSEVEAGTEIELSIPGDVAYEDLPARARFRLFR
jgi:signal transduction histidine kinase/ligand-binding sensor domain-containing protein